MDDLQRTIEDDVNGIDRFDQLFSGQSRNEIYYPTEYERVSGQIDRQKIAGTLKAELIKLDDLFAEARSNDAHVLR